MSDSIRFGGEGGLERRKCALIRMDTRRDGEKEQQRQAQKRGLSVDVLLS